MTKFEILKQYFGYDTFRPGQETLIDSILSGRDVLGILPTGGGKSLCYQVPALMLPGITIVISPLISLMRDQVQVLNAAGVHAAYINSSLTENQIRKALQFASEGRYKIIYVAPERLLTDAMLTLAAEQSISLVAVDEAHCISQWGQDFRPSYKRITEFISYLSKRPVIAAFTATATVRVQRDIEDSLGLQNEKLLITGFDRPNLYFAVKKQKDKAAYIVQYLRNHTGDSGIIYCATRKAVDSLYDILKEQGFSIGKYHAGLSSEERTKAQDDFLYDRTSVIIATNAFGMGIDKSNVRFVIHYNMPSSIENYYQEAGRAGRDGLPADCILLYHAQDMIIQRLLIEHEKPKEETPEEEIEAIRTRNMQRLRQMQDYCFSRYCLREFILRYFGEASPESCGNCSVCLGEAESDEITAYQTSSAIKKAKAAKEKADAARSLTDMEKALFEILRAIRLRLASEEQVPPFVIFSDRSLRDMAIHVPETTDDFLRINGVGQAKLEKYGEAFLTEIKSYVQEHGRPTGSEGWSSAEGNTENRKTYQVEGQRSSEEQQEPMGEDRIKLPLPPEWQDRYRKNVHGPKVDFYLTKRQAEKAMKALQDETAEPAREYRKDDKTIEKGKLRTAAELGQFLSDFRDPDVMKRLFGSTITRKMVEEGYVKEINTGKFRERRLTLSGEQAGLRMLERTGQKGQVYLDVYYGEEASELVIRLFTTEEKP